MQISTREECIPHYHVKQPWKFVVLKHVSGSFLYSTHNARTLSRILSLAYDINFILPRAHTLISLMSCYDEEQGSELSGIQLNRVPPERHREWSLAAGGSRKIKAKYERRAFFSSRNNTSNNFKLIWISAVAKLIFRFLDYFSFRFIFMH